jgi:hypothetical protein
MLWAHIHLPHTNIHQGKELDILLLQDSSSRLGKYHKCFHQINSSIRQVDMEQHTLRWSQLHRDIQANIILLSIELSFDRLHRCSNLQGHRHRWRQLPEIQMSLDMFLRGREEVGIRFHRSSILSDKSSTRRLHMSGTLSQYTCLPPFRFKLWR